MTQVTLIAAMEQGRGIGDRGDIPWRLPEDWKYFRAQTLGKPVVMGRLTFESIGKPLKGRRNVVITRRKELHPGVEIVRSPEEALELLSEEPEIMIAGGESVYRAFLPMAHRLLLTLLHTRIEPMDTFFPAWDRDVWRCVQNTRHERDEKHPFAFDFTEWTRTEGGLL